MAKLNSRPQLNTPELEDKTHIIDSSDTTDDAFGSSKYTTWEKLKDLFFVDKGNGGAVKIDKNGDGSEPSFSLVAGVPQQILYTNPVLDAETYFPYGATEDITSIYAPSVTVGGTPYTGIFLENLVLGQPQMWRISFNFSGKLSNSAEGVCLTLKNPISGFTRHLNITLPEGITSGEFIVVDVQTYADTNSLQAPLGSGTGGYQLFIETTKATLDLVIKDITRLNYKF